MIDKEVFKEEWRAILGRFGKKADVDQAARYFEFLAPLMDTPAFVKAARHVWATARFFPRPADFLNVNAGEDWEAATNLLRRYRVGPGVDSEVVFGWWEDWRKLSPACAGAMEAVSGDVEQLKGLLERQPLKFKDEWERAYEQAATRMAVASLPRPQPPKQLTSA